MQAQSKQVKDVEVPADGIIEQKKTVQRFRTRMRVHLCRAKQTLRKKQVVRQNEAKPPGTDASRMEEAEDNVDEKIRHNDVRISFDVDGTRLVLIENNIF